MSLRTHLPDRAVASGPAEDEEDRRQQVLGLEQPHDLGAVDAVGLAGRSPAVPGAVALDPEPPWPLRWCRPGCAPRNVPAARPPAAASRASSGLTRLVAPPMPATESNSSSSFDAHEHVLFERHGALLRHDHVGVAAHGLQPVAELLGVRDRGAERDQPHRLRAGG